MTPARLAAILATHSATLLVLACGGDAGEKPLPPPAVETPAPTRVVPAVVEIRGGERIEWSQLIHTGTDVRAYRFKLYVDGAEQPLTEIQCGETPGTDGHPCSARLPQMLPGRHVLELTVVFNTRESQRSPALTVTLAAPSQTPPSS